ncbi:MAG: hypothetical protein AAB767_01440 [Patescibacteria group bacterium]
MRNYRNLPLCHSRLPALREQAAVSGNPGFWLYFLNPHIRPPACGHTRAGEDDRIWVSSFTVLKTKRAPEK